MQHLNWHPRVAPRHHLSSKKFRIALPLVDRTYHLLCLRLRLALPLGRLGQVFDNPHRSEREGPERFDRSYLVP